MNQKSRYLPFSRPTWPGALKDVLIYVAFGLAYYLLGEAGLSIDTGYPGVTPFWPASGLSLAVLIIFGPRYWPGIFIGIGLLAYQHGIPSMVAFLSACGQVLEGLTGWFFVTRFRMQLNFRHVREVIQFAAIAFIVPMISSVFGSFAMVAAKLVEWQEFMVIWSMWWLGDSVGILLVVPFILVWRNFYYYFFNASQIKLHDVQVIEDCHYIFKSERLGQFVIYVLLLVLAAVYGFTGFHELSMGKLGLFYLILPLMVFIAISFEQFGVTLGSILVSLILLYSYDSAWVNTPSDAIMGLLVVVLFISITTITSVVVASLFTERRQSEKELRASHKRLQESELRLRQLSENINEVFWLTDAMDDHVIYVSPSIEEVWGREASDFYNKPGGWMQSIHEADKNRVNKEYEEFRKSGKFDTEYRLVRADGEVRWIHDKGFPVYDESGNFYRLAGIAEDITDKKIAEEQKDQQEEERARLSRYISVGELGTSLAHEINQPLTSIICYAQGGLNRAREGRLSDKDVQEVFSRLSEEAERAGRIINKLRDFVNRKEIKFSSVDINELVMETLNLVENKIKTSNIKVIYVLGKSLPMILVDSVLTQQVILNLVINAIESMEETAVERILTIMTEIQGDYVHVSFRDTGAGVPEDQREDIFTPLFTTKKHGIGLGLPIANSIIESMGGELRAYRGNGPGYVFEFTLPIKQRHDGRNHALSNRE
ncbi:MAG: MASE1 domain-containing protein [Thiohalophilus sp.]